MSTRSATRLLLNGLRGVRALVWVALLLISVGLGPLALALHTTGALGRLFAEAIENEPPDPATSLQAEWESKRVAGTLPVMPGGKQVVLATP